MGNTKAGGLKASIKIKELYGSDFYKKIGAKGGSKYHPESRTFRRDTDLARIAGKIGGTASSRKGIKNKKETK